MNEKKIKKKKEIDCRRYERWKVSEWKTRNVKINVAEKKTKNEKSSENVKKKKKKKK